MNEPFIVFGAPEVADAEIQEVLDTLNQAGWAQGHGLLDLSLMLQGSRV